MTIVYSHPKEIPLWGGRDEKSGKDWEGFFFQIEFKVVPFNFYFVLNKSNSLPESGFNKDVRQKSTRGY